MPDDLVKRLRNFHSRNRHADRHDAADRIEELERALLDIFDYECRTSSTSLIACTAREALWPSNVDGKEDDRG